MISATTTRTMVRKGCEAYLAYVIDTIKARPSVSDIHTVSDIPDVFPEELSGLTLQREIEFAIDVVPGTTPASITLYKMALLELKELKLQWKELLEKGFICVDPTRTTGRRDSLLKWKEKCEKKM